MENNYINIQGWMVTALKLSGNNLLTFALVFGFSQDGESEFNGSVSYVCKWLNCSKPTASKALKELTESGLLIKIVTVRNGVHFNSYKVSLEGVKKLYISSKETLHWGGKETLPNNTINSNIIEYIEEPVVFSFKKSLLGLGIDANLVNDFILVRKAKKAANTETVFNSVVKNIEIAKITPNEAIRFTVERSWQTFKADWYANAMAATTTQSAPPQVAAPRRPFTG